MISQDENTSNLSNRNYKNEEFDSEKIRLFNIESIKKMFYSLLCVIGIPLFINLLNILRIPFNFKKNMDSIPDNNLPPNTPPPYSNPIGNLPPQSNNLTPPNFPLNSNIFHNPWPIWGTILIPSIFELIFGTGVFIIIGLICFLGYKYYNSNKKSPNLIGIILIGTLSIILTNLTHGYSIGIYIPIGGDSEIYWDAIEITNPFNFISDFNSIQGDLSVHAQTQPPGAVLLIYFFYIILHDPAKISIGLCVFSSVFSSIFLFGIFRKFFPDDKSKFGVLIFLFLPAVQIYYLANIYAIVATLSFGALYCYLSENKYFKIIGTTFFIGILSFTTFLSIWILLFLGFYEFFNNGLIEDLKKVYGKESNIIKLSKKIYNTYKSLLLITLSLVGGYIFLYFSLNFNYFEAFIFASNLENPNGFMLFTNPYQYFITRLQDIFDIIIFFGPVLLLLFIYGFKAFKNNKMQNLKEKQIFYITFSALFALFVLFLVGAPKKGETARICLFILPFLLIPILKYIINMKITNKDLLKLLILVFAQSIFMQSIGLYIW